VDLGTIGEGGKIKNRKRQKKVPLIIAGAAIIFIAVLLYFLIPLSNNNYKNETVKTIAVLPFVNMSPDPGQKYFSDGLSEALINVLSKNPKLRVTARTSSFSFEGTKTDIKTIAQKLNVNNILEGSVQKSENNLRISADLVNVNNESTLWSNTYDGTLDNIFALQDSISHSVAKALNAALLGKEVKESEQETNPEAYNAFLLGKHLFDLRGKENFEEAATYYQKALSIDSTYAPAWVGLASTHSVLANNGIMPMINGYRKARQEVEKALKLDPNLAEAFSFLGWIKWSYDWDWSGADELYRRALALEPDNASVIRNAAALEYTLGRFSEAIKLTRRSIELNPISSSGYNNLGLYSWYAGLLDESQKAHRKCLELNPQYPGAHTFLGRVYLWKGQPDSALIEIKKETDPFWQLYGFALVYYTLGKKNESDTILDALIKKYQFDSAYQIAEIYAYRGEKDKAFDWLERAYKQRDGGLAAIKGDPLLNNIEKDYRYTAFMKKMKLPI
jgi:TolB-like protein/Flp pilus assembly protein TadD